MQITLNVNGSVVVADVESDTLLTDLLRNHLGLTGAKIGCDSTSCGACTVLLNGLAVKSCTLLAVQANRGRVETVEGLAIDGELHPVQDTFIGFHALQCGFCTPGMVMSAVALLRENPKPSEDEIRHAIEGNLCRCTGYFNIVEAIDRAGAILRDESPELDTTGN